MLARSPVAEAVIFRVGLAAAGGLFLCLAPAAARIQSALPLNVIVAISLGGAGLFMLVSAGLNQPHRSLRWLILGAYVCEVFVQAFVWAQTSRLPDLIVADSGLYTELGGELIRRGQNPYTWDYGGVYDLYRTRQDAATPRLNGAPESNYPYPALPFLLAAPFQAVGLPGVFSLSIIAHAALLALIFLAAPRQWQPVILMPALVSIGSAGFDFTSLTLIGNLDIVWALALAGMAAAWRRPIARAILFGVAASLKQGPALLAPFLLIRLWRDEDKSLEHTVRFILVSAATFLLFNGPFILWNPAAWFEGCTEPLRDALIILSQGGLSTLSQIGVVYLPKSFFLLATLTAFSLAIFIYWRHYDSLREAFWILPGAIMWFSFRSLVPYWLYWAFPMIVSAARGDGFDLPARTTQAVTTKPSWKPTLAALLGALAALSALGAVMASPVAPVQIKLRLPMLASDGRVERLTLEVANLSRETLTPRFAIQSARSVANPLPWYIEAGPRSLHPGQSAVYNISNHRADRAFFAQEAVQIVVTDAGGDYALRAVLTVEPDRAYLWPDAIPNADYRIWNMSQTAPIFWSLFGSGLALPVSEGGRDGVRLSLESAPDAPRRMALANTILFPPKPFGIWLYPPADDPEVAYGIEILDGEHRLWVLFGPQAYAGPAEEGLSVIHRAAPAGEWSYHEIDLRAVYAEAGQPLPPLRRVSYRGMSLDAQEIELRLLFIAGESPINEAIFGPLAQKDYRVPPPALMAETLDDPAAYYARLGEAYERERNYQRALEAYRRALDFAPGRADLLEGVERVKQQITEEGR